MSAFRIWLLAEMWTFEMLNLPTVWEAVEKVANMLLKRGSIDEMAEVFSVCEPIDYLWMRLPKWKPRLDYKPKESGETGTKSQND
jgi:hypothetical protein